MKNILFDRRFWPVFLTQFLGAFNDNVFKNAIGILIAYKAYTLAGLSPEQMVSLCGGIFILPFFLFSGLAGELADKYRKPRIMQAVKLLEVAIMILGLIGFVRGNLELLLIGLFLMGIHSSLFGPVKYSILPHLLHPDELVAGNAYVETATFIAILLGSILGVQLIAMPETGAWITGILVIAVAAAGFGTSLAVNPIAAVAPELKLRFNPIATAVETVRIAREVKSVFLSVLAISWFWFFGICLLSIFPVYCKDFLKADESVVTLFLVLFSVGIGAGSILCERLSFKRTELGLVPLGSIGLSLFAFDIFLVGQPVFGAGHALIDWSGFLSSPAGRRIAIDLFLLSIFGGFYTVPLYTFIQQRSAAAVRSRVIAANNILNALFMVVAAGFLMGLYAFGLSYPQIFLILALLNIAVAVYIYTVIPEFLLRLVVWVVVNLVYRLKVTGREHLPAEGPFVIVCNHVSYMDGLVLGSACPRPVRFVMHYSFMKLPMLRWFFRDLKIIPIAGVRENRAILQEALARIDRELETGEVVGLFPEGHLTKDGKLQPFQTGIETILARQSVPVVPACLHGLWGSYFSCKDEGHRRPFRRRWSRIGVTFGPPLPPEEATAERLQAIIAGMRIEAQP